MSSRKQCGSRFFPGTQRLRYPRYLCPAERGTRLTRPKRDLRRMLCVKHLFYQLGWFWTFCVEDTNMEDDELKVYLKWTLHSIDLLYKATQYTVTFVVQWDPHSPEVSMNIWTAKVCVPWFAILSIEGHPNFLQNIFLCCWNDLITFYCHYSFCTVFWSAAFI